MNKTGIRIRQDYFCSDIHKSFEFISQLNMIRIIK